MFGLLSCLLYASVSLAQVQQNISTNSTAENATAFALLYGYPLLGFQKLASPFIATNIVNKLLNVRQLATAGLDIIVKPNVDTLYSVAIFDIGNQNINLTVPEIPANQYALFSFYDPFGDNFANVGPSNFNKSGSYELSRRSGNGPVGVFPTNTSSTSSDSSVASIQSPTDHGILLIRWLIDNNYDEVHALQNATSFNTIAKGTHFNGTSVPSLQDISRPINESSVAANVLELLAQYAHYDPPQLPSQESLVNAQLSAAGFTGASTSNQTSSYTAPSGIDLESANRTALASAAAAAAAPSNNVPQNNGWCIPQPAVSGDFQNGTNYAYRAAIASSAYLMIKAPLAVYPSWTNSTSGQCSDSTEEYTLGSNDSYIYTFSRRPPLQSLGFWSITAYSNNYLIPNDLNRYSIGDRSNLTFADGTKVYGGNADGTFQVLLQPADVPPPANWTSNWIPGPAGGGKVEALLRWYGAEEELMNGTYQYPIVSRQAAIVASQSGGSNATGSTGTLANNGAAGLPPPWLLSSAAMAVLACAMA